MTGIPGDIPLEQRYTVNDLTGCWIYRGNPDADGYGRVGSTVAHRVYYEAFVGPIGEGLELDHLCVRRICVNPAHMEPVTSQVNHDRSIPYRPLTNQVSASCRRGHLYTDDSTGYSRTVRGGVSRVERYCKICARDAKHAYRARVKQGQTQNPS